MNPEQEYNYTSNLNVTNKIGKWNGENLKVAF